MFVVAGVLMRCGLRPRTTTMTPVFISGRRGVAAHNVSDAMSGVAADFARWRTRLVSPACRTMPVLGAVRVFVIAGRMPGFRHGPSLVWLYGERFATVC